MATNNRGRKTTNASGKNSRQSSNKNATNRQYTEQESELFHEVGLILLFAVAVFLFLCNF